MPDRTSHLEKARNNENLLTSEMSSSKYANYYDWVVTVTFYTALHYVDANLARYGIHPRCHEGKNGRNAFVSRRLRTVSSKYLTLYTRSRYARYIPYSERHINASEVKELLGWVLTYFKTLP